MRVFNLFFFLLNLPGTTCKAKVCRLGCHQFNIFLIEHLFITNYFSIIFHPSISSISSHLNCSSMSLLIQLRVEDVESYNFAYLF